MAAANRFFRFAVAILFVYIGMEPGIKAEVPHCRQRRKKSPSVSAAICGENRQRFSPAIKFVAIGV